MSPLARSDTPNMTWVVSRLDRSDTPNSCDDIGVKSNPPTQPRCINSLHGQPAIPYKVEEEEERFFWQNKCALRIIGYASYNGLTHTVYASSRQHAYSYIQHIGRKVKTMNAKHTEKSPIHENADANITCDFGDGDISRYRSRFPYGQPHTSLAGL